MLPVYLLSLLIVLTGFTAYPLISKRYIGGVGYKKFVPSFLGLTAIGTIILPLIVYRLFPLNVSALPLLALLGLMYTAAAYLVFYSLERYNVGIISSVVGSQNVLIALFTSIFFLVSSLKGVIIPFLIIIAGIIIVGISKSGRSKFSIYIILTFAGVMLWVFIWVLFYTINTNYPLSDYAVLQSFAFLFSLPIAFILREKKVKEEKYGEKMKFILLAGLMNGVATGVFSFAYKFNAVLTPFVSQLGIPLVLIFSFLLLKERMKRQELLGVILIVLGSFLYILT